MFLMKFCSESENVLRTYQNIFEICKGAVAERSNDPFLLYPALCAKD